MCACRGRVCYYFCAQTLTMVIVRGSASMSLPSVGTSATPTTPPYSPPGSAGSTPPGSPRAQTTAGFEEHCVGCHADLGGVSALRHPFFEASFCGSCFHAYTTGADGTF